MPAVLTRALVATCFALSVPFSVVPVAAQEAGEPVKLDAAIPLGSLKTAPTTQDLLDMLTNPIDPVTLKPTGLRPGLNVFPVNVNPFNINPVTAQTQCFLDALTGELIYPSGFDFSIPLDAVPCVTGVNPDTGQVQLGRPIELPRNERDFIVNRDAAEKLGKALFWDMQVGSDGVQACGTCHVTAGVDPRTKNQLNPNHLGGDLTLQVKGPNQDLTASDFPFHKLVDINIPGEPLLNPVNVARDANDVASSMGVVFRQFVDIPAPGPGAFGPTVNGVAPLLPDIGNAVPDPIPVFQGLRRVEPRNTPTMHASTFNYDNFWDGRARHDFNGGSVFGAADPQSHVFVDNAGALAATREIIRLSSIASLATGPALSDFEMSFKGRNWAKIGKKLLQSGVTPLANQLVSATDSELGALSRQATAPGTPGLATTYAAMIQAAFAPQYWANTAQHLNGAPDANDPFDGYSLTIAAGPAAPADTNQFTQMEANFSLFWGLAVQAYFATLIPDDTGLDRFLDANPQEFLGTGFVPDIDPATPGVQVVGLTTRQLHGLDIFQGSNHSGMNPFFKVARCSICHTGTNLTDHTGLINHALVQPDLATGQFTVMTGFNLEDELLEPAQDAVEMENQNFTLDINGFPTGISVLDNGVYNIGVRPFREDLGRGDNDPFGHPFSLSALAMKNAGASCPVGGPCGPTATTVTPTTVTDPLTGVSAVIYDVAFTPALPGTLAPFANEFPVGDAPPFFNTPIFLPEAIATTLPLTVGIPSGTFPGPNRVQRKGSFKAAQLRNVELTGPYFHTGSMLTLRQVVDFYSRGGDFPVTNGGGVLVTDPFAPRPAGYVVDDDQRDAHIVNLNVNFFSQLNEAEKDALVDFMIALTDPRVKIEAGPFDRPEVILPLDGTAPDNTGGRAAMLADARFTRFAEVGAAGHPATPLPNFLGISSNFADKGTGRSHFDSVTIDVGAPANQAPIAANDKATTRRNRAVDIRVLRNDVDPDGTINPNSIRIVTGPANGTVQVVIGGTVTYSPALNFQGVNTFTYTVNDNQNATSNLATVTITVRRG